MTRKQTVYTYIFNFLFIIIIIIIFESVKDQATFYYSVSGV